MSRGVLPIAEKVHSGWHRGRPLYGHSLMSRCSRFRASARSRVRRCGLESGVALSFELRWQQFVTQTSCLLRHAGILPANTQATSLLDETGRMPALRNDRRPSRFSIDRCSEIARLVALTAEREIGFERLDQPASPDSHPVARAVELESAGVEEEVVAEQKLRQRARFQPEPGFSLQVSAHSCLNPAIE